MASGDSLVTFTPLHNEPPASNFATIDYRNNHPVLDFDAATDEEAVFSAVMPRHYDGGGVTVTIGWMASTATSGNCIWQAAFMSVTDDADDLDTKAFAAFNDTGQVTPASASGEVAYDTITFTDGVDMDSVAVGEYFKFKVRRDADGTTATEDMTNDAELVFVEIRET